MKIDTSSVKRWKTILNVEGTLYRVIDIGHTHMGRGGATYNFKVKNIISGSNNTLTYKAGTILDTADISNQSGIYLYHNGDTYSFMENDTGEIHDVPAKEIDDIIPYLKDNLDVYLMIYEEKIIGVILPTTISYIVKETLPWDRWDRANAGKKPATLETGMEVQVPLYVSEGDSVTINTDTGQTA